MISHDDLITLINDRLAVMGISAREASIRAVNNPELIRSIRNYHSPSLSKLQKLLEVLDLEIALGDSDSPPEATEVPLLGLVGAGSRVAYFNDQIGLDTVTFDCGDTEGLAAAEVRGYSMEPVYMQGDILFFYPEDPTRFDIARHVGQDCIVTLEEDSSALLKTIECGSQPGTWNLHSHNPEVETMRDQVLRSASAIHWIKRGFPYLSRP